MNFLFPESGRDAQRDTQYLLKGTLSYRPLHWFARL